MPGTAAPFNSWLLLSPFLQLIRWYAELERRLASLDAVTERALQLQAEPQMAQLAAEAAAKGVSYSRQAHALHNDLAFCLKAMFMTMAVLRRGAACTAPMHEGRAHAQREVVSAAKARILRRSAELEQLLAQVEAGTAGFAEVRKPAAWLLPGMWKVATVQYSGVDRGLGAVVLRCR